MDPQSVPLLSGLFLTDRLPEPDPAPTQEQAREPIGRGVVIATAVTDVERLHDDLAFAAEIGLTHVRLDVPWAAAQPKEGRTDGGVMESVHSVATAARAAGLQPWLRLLQPEVPHWFDNEGGFTDERTAALWWPRWVEAVTDHLGDVAAGWVPFEAPFAMAQRLVPDDPRKHGELMHHLVVAWRDAWRILRGGQPVATSLDVATERATGPTQAHLDAARRREQLRWGLWLDGLAHGIVRIPGRAAIEMPDLAGACDVLGLAVRDDVASALYRAADQGPECPLAITFRITGSNDTEAADHVTAMWRGVREAAGSLRVASVTVTPFLDRGDALGLATATRWLKDAGEAFLQPP